MLFVLPISVDCYLLSLTTSEYLRFTDDMVVPVILINCEVVLTICELIDGARNRAKQLQDTSASPYTQA